MGRTTAFAAPKDPNAVAFIPRYVQVAEGVDRDWIDDARCRPGRAPTADSGFMWTILPGERRDGIRGDKWIQLALLECSLCPAQWACVSYAIATESTWGTWGCSQNDRAFLAMVPDWETEVEDACTIGVDVQSLVARLRNRQQTELETSVKYKVLANVEGLGVRDEIVELEDEELIELFAAYLGVAEDEDDELTGVMQIPTEELEPVSSPRSKSKD